MMILIAGVGRRRSLQRISMDECGRRRRPFRPSLATRTLQRHRSISMVEEPMKTLHVQRSWRFSVFSRRKLLHQIPRPDRLFDRMIDFAIARRIVNAANKN
jgi:hypothetical protein